MNKNFKIIKTASSFDKLETLELIDLSLLNKVISSNKLNTVKYVFLDGFMEYENEREFLLKIKSKISNNKLKVCYKMSKTGYGRVFPFKGLSLACVRREVRHTLAKNDYVDIDMENCHPNILLQLCLANGVKCDELQRYCTQRDECLKEIMTEYKVSRGEAKSLFLVLQYCGTFETWTQKNNLINVKPTEFISKFATELRTICALIYNQNNDIEKACKAKDKVMTNPHGTVSSNVLQEYERRLLEFTYGYFKSKNLDMSNCVLCADGLMILKNQFNENMLKELSVFVEEKSGFKMTFTQKIMDEDFTNELDEKLVVEPSKADSFDIEYFKTIRTYQQKKQYFEMFVCKIMQPETLYLFTSLDKTFQNDVCLYREKGIKECFKQLKSGNFDENNKETKFIDEWLADENIKVYNNIDFIPFNKDKIITNTSVYNTFKGFNSLIGSEYNKQKRSEILKPFDDLGIEICEGSKEYWLYFKKYLAQMIQKPNERLPIAFIIKGKQGTGKSMIMNAIGNLINEKYYISSSNANDFFGNFAEGFLNKLLVNMNETEGKDTMDFEGRMKSFITEQKIVINQKGIRPFQVNNYARLIITTNKNNPVKIDITSKDRRYVVFKTTDKYLDKKYTDNFWIKLMNYFKTAGFLSALYDELNEMDIENYNFASNRPITESYKEMRKLYVPLESLFFEHYLEEYLNHPLLDVEGVKLYDLFCEYCNNFAPENNVKSLKKFYNNFNSLEFPVQIIRPQNKTTYRFKPRECYKHMLNRGWRDKNDCVDIDEDVETVEVEECNDYDFSLV